MLTLEQYAALVLMRSTDMMGLLDMPVLSADGMLSGLCCREDGIGHRYFIDTSSAMLVRIYEERMIA